MCRKSRQIRRYFTLIASLHREESEDELAAKRAVRVSVGFSLSGRHSLGMRQTIVIIIIVIMVIVIIIILRKMATTKSTTLLARNNNK